MTKKSMGYPLPPGEAYEVDLQCMMIFYPDRPEYRQALFGSLDYLATWLAWERDADKRGQDAARSWRAAVEATRECIEMGTCDNILELLTLVEENTRQCWCAVENDVTGGTQYTDEVEDGVGDVPQNIIDAGYATGTTDWAGFDDYKCMISHIMVDLIEQTIRDIIPHMDENGKIIGGIGVVVAVLGAILLTGGTFVLALGVITATGISAALWGLFNEITIAGMETLADDISDAHDALACAIYSADGTTDAIESLNAAIDDEFVAIDAAIIKNLNIGPRLRALYAGRYDQTDIAENMASAGLDETDYNCTAICPEGDYIYEDDWTRASGEPGAGTGNYAKSGTYGWADSSCGTNPSCWVLDAGTSGSGNIWKTYDYLVADLSLDAGDPIRVTKVEIDYELKFDITGWIRLQIRTYDGGWTTIGSDTDSGITGIGTTGTLTVELAEEDTELMTDNFIELRVDCAKTGGSGINTLGIRRFKFVAESE